MRQAPKKEMILVIHFYSFLLGIHLLFIQIASTICALCKHLGLGGRKRIGKTYSLTLGICNEGKGLSNDFTT